MKIYSFIEAQFVATKKFTEELFDEKTIKDDEFVKLLFIEARKELKRIATRDRFNIPSPSKSSNTIFKDKFSNSEVPFSTDEEIFPSFRLTTDLPFDNADESWSEKPKVIPNQLIKTICEKSNSLFSKENFEEMPRYVC